MHDDASGLLLQSTQIYFRKVYTLLAADQMHKSRFINFNCIYACPRRLRGLSHAYFIKPQNVAGRQVGRGAERRIQMHVFLR